MVKSNGKSGWQSITQDPSKFKKDLESSTVMPETFEEGLEFIKDRTWET